MSNITATVHEYDHPGVPRFEATAIEPLSGGTILATGPTKEEALTLLREYIETASAQVLAYRAAEEARKTPVAVEEVQL